MNPEDNLNGQLSETDLNELVLLAKESIDKNTISLIDFNAIMEKWRAGIDS